MKNEHRYILEPGSKKHQCPECGKKTFVFYIDIENGNHLPMNYGRCDRESKCAYHLNPYSDGYAKAIWEAEQGKTPGLIISKPKAKRTKPAPTPEPVYFDVTTFKQTLSPERFANNVFIQNLLKRVKYPFEPTDIEKVASLYHLGTVINGYRAGAVCFPFINADNDICAIQVKQFDEQNHTTGTDFLHSIIEKHYTRNNMPLPEWLAAYTKQDKRVNCLFGAHLLSRYPNNPIALVEAPKTAVYGTLYFGLPESTDSLIWLAVYNKSSFSFDKIKALKGRDVCIFPDLSKDGGTFKEWQTKAKEYERRLPGTRFIISELLEQLAPARDKDNGNDIADYLIEQDWKLFRQPLTEQPAPAPVEQIPAPAPAHTQAATEQAPTNEQATTTIGHKIPEAQGCNKIETGTQEPKRAHDPDDFILRPGINHSLHEIAQAMKRIDPAVDPLRRLERITKENKRVHYCKVNSQVYVTPF